MMKNGKPRVLDLFAGAGGFSLGFTRAGFNVDTAVELDSWACETLRDNHPLMNVVQADISKISDAEITDLLGGGRPAGIIGGPPCQGFSHSNITKKDSHDPRNSLFIHFARFVRLLKPQFFVIENVPGLLRTKLASGQQAIEIILKTFEQLAYETHFELLNAEDFGVPQIRERLFVAGFQRGLQGNPFPTPTHHRAESNALPLFDTVPARLSVPLWEAISDLPALQAGQGEEPATYPGPPQSDYQREMREHSTNIWNHVAMNHSPRVVERFKRIRIGQSQSDVSPEHAPRVRSNGHLISAKRYDQNNRRLHPDKPSHTIPASFYANFVHPFQHRNFTAREGARIQSFPDEYIFRGKPTVVSQKLLAREGRVDEKHLCQYNQIGNAVPPKLSEAIAKNILRRI